MPPRNRSHTLLDLDRAPMRRGRRLGRGGSAKTYVVTLHRKDTIVETYCLKEFDVVDDRSKALMTELQVLSRLKHPAIATFHDFVAAGTLLDGVPLEHPGLLFELVDGVNLRELLNSIPERCLAPHLVVEIALGLCDALSYAHEHVVHRDISAGNVMVTRGGAIKLLDFGVAHVLPRPGEPRTSTMCGKPCYMSPEQAGAFGIVEVDGRSDLFSVGVLLYEMLAGVRPFDAPTESETMARAERGMRLPLSADERAPWTPPELIEVIDTLLQPRRDDRFNNARECFDALDRIAPPRATRYELGRLVASAHAEAHPTAEYDVRTAAGELTTKRSGEFTVDDDEAALLSTAETTSGFRIRRRIAPMVLAAAGFVAIAGLSFAYILNRPNVPAASATAARAVTAEAPAPLAVAKPAVPLAADLSTALLATPVETLEPQPLPSPTAPETNDTNVDAPPTPVTHNRERSELAILDVSVLPTVGQVWLDGRSVGWSPLHLKVRPGRHSIGVGDSDPQVTKSIAMKAGESRSLLVTLQSPAKLN